MAEEMEEMPIPVWLRDHERRITTLEASFGMFSQKMDSVEKNIESVKKTIESDNEEQKKLLNTLVDHHLATKKMKLSNFWKVIINIFGAGGIVTTIILAVIQLLQM